MDFFSEHGHDERKRGDFTNRLKFAESKLKLSNNTHFLTKIIEGSLNLREFFASKIDREKSVEAINERLGKDGYELQKIQDHYKVAYINGPLVETKKNLSGLFIEEQIENCHKHIAEGRYAEAIEEAKTMLALVMVAVIESFGEHPNEDKNFEDLYKQVRVHLQLNVVEPEKVTLGMVQTLSGFESVIEGVFRMNGSSDARFEKPTPKKSWARLMVNSSKTLAEFFVDYRENLR